MTELDWSHGELAEGLRCYQSEEFFEAHEHWESVWLASQEPVRTFLQALIQVAAAFHHYQRGNQLGTRSLLQAALRKLNTSGNLSVGVATRELCDDVFEWLKVLERGEMPSHLPIPQIRLKKLP
jgi:uncharacterized protein